MYLRRELAVIILKTYRYMYIITENCDFCQNCRIWGQGKSVNTESKKLPEFLRIYLEKKSFNVRLFF